MLPISLRLERNAHPRLSQLRRTLSLLIQDTRSCDRRSDLRVPKPHARSAQRSSGTVSCSPESLTKLLAAADLPPPVVPTAMPFVLRLVGDSFDFQYPNVPPPLPPK